MDFLRNSRGIPMDSSIGFDYFQLKYNKVSPNSTGIPLESYGVLWSPPESTGVHQNYVGECNVLPNVVDQTP